MRGVGEEEKECGRRYRKSIGGGGRVWEEEEKRRKSVLGGGRVWEEV